MLEVTFDGIADVMRRLHEMATQLPEDVGLALREEGEIEMTEAKRRTPVKTGVLRASGHVLGPFYASREASVELRFGGPAIPYAVRVHEDLHAFHRVGQAKYLESVVNESAPYLARRVAVRVARSLAG